MIKFRLAVKRVFLTYPNCNLSLKEALKEFKNKLLEDLDKYVISSESHLDGSKHIHAYLELKRVKNIQDNNFYDIGGFHGMYESVRNKRNVISYIVKNGVFVTNMNIEAGVEVSLEDKMIALVGENKLEEALKLLDSGRGKEMGKGKWVLNNYTKYENALHKMNERWNKPKVTPKYEFEDFKYPQAFFDWVHNYSNKVALVVEGKAGHGKTQGILAFLIKYDQKVLVVKDINDLKKLNRGDITAIVYDDMNWNVIDPEQRKHLLDPETDASIRDPG